MSYNSLFENVMEILQIFFVNVGDRPIVKVAFNPVEQMITLMRYRLCPFARI